MKKKLSQEISWQILFLLGVIGIILGRLVGDVFGAALGITGDIFFALGVVNFLEMLWKREREEKVSVSRRGGSLGESLGWLGIIGILAGSFVRYFFNENLGLAIVVLGDMFFVLGGLGFLVDLLKGKRVEEDSVQILFWFGVLGVFGGRLIERFIDPVMGQSMAWLGGVLFVLSIAQLIMLKRRLARNSGKRLSFFE